MPTKIADPPALIPDYICINGHTHSVKDLMELSEPASPPPRGNVSESHEFDLLPPYSKWPVGFSRYQTPLRVQHKKLQGLRLSRVLILSPIWLNPKRCSKLPTTVPFVAMRYVLQPPEPLRFYWQFWFKDDESINHVLKYSPQGQWLAQGKYNNEERILSTQKYHSKHRI